MSTSTAVVARTGRIITTNGTGRVELTKNFTAWIQKIMQIMKAWIDKDSVRLYTYITLPLLTIITYINYRNSRIIVHKTSLAVSSL
jgi:hypothetical protein